ncbi:MAG: hypothetical protein ABJG47_16755 [Ekhidna sp.]
MHFKSIISAVVLAMALFSCQQSKKPKPPMVDGNIADFLRLGVEPINLMDGVNLYFYQDEYFVWLAYDYPENSFGTMDLKLLTPNLADTLNIHVSAQLGEWYLKEGAPRPDNPLSELWWNHTGWYANEVWSNGIDRSNENARPKFKNGKAREIQLEKDRFGKGEWIMKAEIRAIQTPNGFASVTFPEEGMHTLNVY